MNAHTILVRARETLAEPHHWTKHTFARNPAGLAVLNVNQGICWCSLGALYLAQSQVGGGVGFSEAVKTLEGALPANRGHAVGTFNDHPDTTHPEVLAAFDRAIEASRP